MHRKAPKAEEYRTSDKDQEVFYKMPVGRLWLKYEEEEGMICDWCVEDELIFRKKADDNMTKIRESFQTTSQRLRCQRR